MFSEIKKVMVVLFMAAVISFGTFGSAVLASDIYQNYAQLSADKVYGTDYAIQSSNTPSTMAVIAIHGGLIEKGTTEVAKSLSAAGGYDYYSFMGTMNTGNMALHITSTNFDEPTARNLVSNSKFTLSVHGCSGTSKVTYLGGLDTALGNQIKKDLTAAGFVVKSASDPLNGSSLSNIVNRNLSQKGVQLEMTKALRDSFYTSSGGASLTLSKYTTALNKAIKTYYVSKGIVQ